MKNIRKPGLRIVKTVIAVTVCLILFKIVDHGVSMYATLACIAMMKETPTESIKSGFHRSIGTLIGGLFASLALYFLLKLNIDYNSWIFIGIVALLLFMTLSLTNILRFDESVISNSTSIVLVIMLSYNTSVEMSLQYSIGRILETLIGIIIAVIVNVSITPKTIELLKSPFKKTND